MTAPARFSDLKKLSQSPAHYRHAVDHDSVQSPTLRRGSGVHAVVLGTPFAVWEDRRAGKAWESFASEHAGIPILNEAEHNTAQLMMAKVKAHPLAARLLLGADMTREQRIDWTRDGRACRGTPDAHGDGILVDLKTTKCSEPEKFSRAAKWYGYHAQLAWYASGLLANGIETRKLYIVGVEATAPHCVTVLELEPSAWLAGDALVASWWERLRQCEAADEWPGYTDAPVRFGIDDETLSIGGEDFEF